VFSSIVVALDLEAAGDRAVPVARALAGLGHVAAELLTVSSPRLAEDIDAFELSRRASAIGWPADAFSIVHSDDVADAIVSHVDDRDALLVMATSAKPPLARRLLGSVSEGVLRATERPVLLVGPRVPPDFDMRRPTLIACIDGTDDADAAVPAIRGWVRTFGGNDPWIAQVVPRPMSRPEAARLTGCAHARRYAERLDAEGVRASWELLHGDDAATSLDDFADHVADPVLVATSARWTGGRWHSITRQLVHRSTRPVLVVPADSGRLAGVAAACATGSGAR
jgi:nucleotide-binding universal stress UspA family protein